jgi:dihydrofolate reductase
MVQVSQANEAGMINRTPRGNGVPAQNHRGLDYLDPGWRMLDTTPEGRGKEFFPRSTTGPRIKPSHCEENDMPRRIIGGAFISLDGVVQAPGGLEEDTSGGFAHGGWLEPVSDEAVGHQVDTLFAGDFDLLLGRRTYDIFAAYWPFMPGENPIAAKFAKAEKYVLTRSNMALEWQASHRLADLDALAKLKAGNGPNLVVRGARRFTLNCSNAGCSTGWC